MDRTPMGVADKLEVWIENTRQDLVKDLIDLARIPSVSAPQGGGKPYGEACAQALEKSMEIARRRGFSPHNHENQCVTLTLPGKTGRTIGIFCHLDVVAAGNGWENDPYTPFLRDGHVFGRGVTDNKGPGVAMLSLLEFLKKEQVALDHTILLYFGSSEENGMHDLTWYLAHEKPPELSLTPDAQFSVCNGEKGHLTGSIIIPQMGNLLSLEGGSASNAVPDAAWAILDCSFADLRDVLDDTFQVEKKPEGVMVRTFGLPAHAAFPESGENAIVKLCRGLLGTNVLNPMAASTLKSYVALFDDCHGSGLGIACEDDPSGKLTAVGGKLRVEQGQLVQTLDIRYPVTADSTKLMSILRDTVAQAGFSVSELTDNPPLYYPPNHPMIKLLNETCNQVLHLDLKPYVIGGGTYARKLPMAVAFGHLLRSRPRPGGSGKGGGHQVDECVSLQGLEDLMRVYLPALLRLDKLSSENLEVR